MPIILNNIDVLSLSLRSRCSAFTKAFLLKSLSEVQVSSASDGKIHLQQILQVSQLARAEDLLKAVGQPSSKKPA